MASYDDYDSGSRFAGFRRTLLIVTLAFFAGIIAAGWGASRMGLIVFDSWGRPLNPAKIHPSTPIPPLMIAPPAASGEVSLLAERLGRIEARVETIDTRTRAASGNAGRSEGLLIAMAARRALDRGVALGVIEALLRDRFGSSEPQAVATIITVARQPITLDELQDGLARIAPQLAGGGGGENWWLSTRRALASLFVVRRADAPSQLPEDRVRRAQAQLDIGHVDGALVEIARLSDHRLADPWIAQARRYVAARRALDMIETSALLEAPGIAGSTQPALADEPAPADLKAAERTP
ncbi:MAG: hypothetical protein JOY90_33720 [Bradyrhizobium sp.]|uniref:hypothetical protein n=1 Tax=Bradyrhizobium sp. TaxID=376 RepID=UPI001D3EBE0F|nr:hypothetical protein [Bradyrhizobium sp.]MBV9565375.1 hypothetical protein [Bradyrhizobium sp.]